MDVNKIYELIGQFLLTYGNLEKTLDCVIEMYIAYRLKNQEASILIKVVINKLNSTKSKIEVLNDLISSFEIDDKSKLDWYELIDDLTKLNNFRNILAHNMYGIDDNNRIIKFKKDWNEVLISVDELTENNRKLQERYRQLFDSVLERDAIYISIYPKLKL